MAYKRISTRQEKARSGIALGGIGAGWFELRQDGQTYDWNIFNNRPLGVSPNFNWDTSSMLFFIVRFQEEGKDPKMKLLQIENKYGAAGIREHEHYYIVPWLSGVDKIEYEGSFPFINIKFSDKDMPFDIKLECFSPFIPGNIKDSALPAAFFNFSIKSKTRKAVDILLLGSMRNAVGYDQQNRYYLNTAKKGSGYQAFEMSAGELAEDHFSRGTMGLASLSANSSYYLGWEHHHPYYELLIRNKSLANIDDTEGRNPFNENTGKKQAMEFCFSSVGHTARLAKKGDKLEHSFIAAWNFPNNWARKSENQSKGTEIIADHREGHFYSNFFADSTEVIDYCQKNQKRLYKQSRSFHDAFFNSSAPGFILDQINSNLNTFFTSSWLTKEGKFGILEGMNSVHSFAGLCTTDVAMFASPSYACLFPELAKQVIRDYRDFQLDNGNIAHSIGKNFKKLADNEILTPRLDLTSQFSFMALRAFFYSDDLNYLKEIWPSVKKALNYVLQERDMNGDCLPDMEGVMCSYDNFPMYGVASFVAGQFLAAVQAAIAAAEILNDGEAASKYKEVFKKGKEVFEESLWNGKYYRLYKDNDNYHQKDKRPDTDEGCLTDQLIGQWAAHQLGFDHIFDKKRTKTALKNIIKMNYKPDYGLRNCQWPGDGFLHDVDENTWIDQANTVWTGVELAFASFLLYEGMDTEAFKIIKNVDDRYRHWGLYWDHQEFGGRYFRPMSAWAIVNALLGLSISAGRYSFSPKLPDPDCKLFFAHEGGYSHYQQKKTKKGGRKISISALAGKLKLKEIALPDINFKDKKAKLSVKIGKDPLEYRLLDSEKGLGIHFNQIVTLKTGDCLIIEI